MSEIIPSFQAFSRHNLAKTIFRADLPESLIRALPAQSLYIAIKNNGLESSLEIIEMCQVEQLRNMLDFELWEGDKFQDENIWPWLALVDADGSLDILIKLFKSIDLKLVALLIAKYVKTVTFSEPTELPPGPQFYTPDKGYTWISIDIDDGSRNQLLARFLALVFESNADLFYKLVNIAQLETCTSLEEESYQDAVRRLSSEGIPDSDLAAQISSSLSLNEAVKALRTAGHHKPAIEAISPVAPLVVEDTVEPLHSVLTRLLSREEVQAELTLVINAAIVFFKVPFYEESEVARLVQKVLGVINIGLEMLLSQTHIEGQLIAEGVGFQMLYRLGLGRVLNLRKQSNSLKCNDGLTPQEELMLDGCRLSFPELFHEDEPSVDGKVIVNYKPFQHLKEVDQMSKILSGLSEMPGNRSQR